VSVSGSGISLACSQLGDGGRGGPTHLGFGRSIFKLIGQDCNDAPYRVLERAKSDSKRNVQHNSPTFHDDFEELIPIKACGIAILIDGVLSCAMA
jgi:hypothetical protein